MGSELLLELEGVSKYYEDGNVIAVNDVSLKIRRGEFAVIRGPSGSGKSTLLHLMGGLDTPTSGELFFQGKPYRKAFRASLFRLRTIGFVFQAFYLWRGLTVLENVTLPLIEARMRSVDRLLCAQSVLGLVGLGHKSAVSVEHLSMGERQRVAIARALVMQPLLLLADEPTGNLDSKTAEQALDLFATINTERKTTVVMVTHEKESRAHCDRAIELCDGKIV